MIDLQEKIQQAIAQNLPGEVGAALKKRLEQADKDSQDLAAAQAKILSTQSSLDDARRQVAEHESLDKRLVTVATREQECREREIELDLTIQKSRADSATEMAKFAQDLAMGLVRNTEYRRNRFGDVPVINRDADGGRWSSSERVNLEEKEEAE